MASRPVSPAQPFSASKKHTSIQPNAHPYAIKTTSSALLSRSSSSPHSAQHTKHHYVPSSPTRPRHRHSSSLSLAESVSDEETRPPPLPTPPSFFSTSPSQESFHTSTTDDTTPRRTRAETLPAGAINPITDVIEDTNLSGDLPPNPKQWNTHQLSTYLSTSLREEDGLDDLGVEAVLYCVRERGFTGRELLTLTDADLATTSLTDSQRARLLGHSRTLRADVLRGRIYVDSYHSKEISDRSKDTYARSLRSVRSSPFHNDLYRSCVSSVDLFLPSSSDLSGEFPLPSAMSLHHSNAISEDSARRYRDLAYIRTRRRGNVKGLVDSWQRGSGRASRSGSESSVNGSDAESESSADEQSGAALHDEPSSPVETSSPAIMADSTILRNPPPPYTSLTAEDEDELTMEELLASSAPLQGARAWEADVGLGETVKHISIASVSPDPPLSQPAGLHDTGKGTGGRGRNARSQKRVVTAIFAGSPSA
ncbi:hypothetical protein PAXRUDRAFT_68227, partial [Paxillus rubicundulus Ve08.2h10]